MFKKILKKVVNIFQWMLTIVLVLVVLLLIFTTFNPIKSFQIFRVMSGSMTPALPVGSIVFVTKVNPETLKINDIITFNSEKEKNSTVTHRIVSISSNQFNPIITTKGDANQTADIDSITFDKVLGKAVFPIPYLGYMSVWMKTPIGFLLLIVFPAILLITSEIWNIKKTLEKIISDKKMV